MRGLFDEVFTFAKTFLVEDKDERRQRVQWLVDQLKSPYVTPGNVRADMYLIGNLAEAAQLAVQQEDHEAIQQLHDWGWTRVENYSKTDARTLEGMKKRCRTAAAALRRMEETNKRVADPGLAMEMYSARRASMVWSTGVSFAAPSSIGGFSVSRRRRTCSHMPVWRL